MTSIDDAEPQVAAALSATNREAWASRRRAIERGRCWIGPDGPRARWPSTVFHAATRVLALALRLTGHYRQWRRAALAPQLVELELSFPHLPSAFDGYRILHLTDPHFDSLPELAAVARRLLAEIEVDVLALTGDLPGRHHAPSASAVALLCEAIAGLHVRDHRLAVLGNHDPADMADALEAAGFRVLLNEALALRRGDARLVVTGLDDVHSFYTDMAHAALMEGADGFRIALVHSPEMADHAAAAGVAFYLCGHTHGGQICLPSGRALFTGLTRCRYAVSGLWRDGAMIGYTSRGLGTFWPPMRHNCCGEMTVITLRRGETPFSRTRSLGAV